MKTREALAYLQAFALAVILFAILALLAWLQPLAPEAGGEPADDARGKPEPQVMVDLRKELPPDLFPPPVPPDPEPQEELLPPDAGASVATEQKGEGTGDAGKSEDQPPPPVEEPRPVEKPVEPEPVKDKGATAPTEVVKNEAPGDLPSKTEDPQPVRPKEPPKAEPKDPEKVTVEPAPSSLQGTREGVLPPLAYTGDTKRLFEMYPRLEVVWVLEDVPRPGAPFPGALYEVVRDKNGELAHRDLRGDGKFGQWYLSTRYYYHQPGEIIGEGIGTADPSGMALWQQRDQILARFGIPRDRAGRLNWGHARHRAETFFLQPVRRTFEEHVAAGKIDFDPARNSRLVVEWGVDPEGQPKVIAADYVPEGGEPVRILGG